MKIVSYNQLLEMHTLEFSNKQIEHIKENLKHSMRLECVKNQIENYVKQHHKEDVDQKLLILAHPHLVELDDWKVKAINDFVENLIKR